MKKDQINIYFKVVFSTIAYNILCIISYLFYTVRKICEIYVFSTIPGLIITIIHCVKILQR